MAEQEVTLERLYELILKLHEGVKEFRRELRAERNRKLDEFSINFSKKINESFNSLNKKIDENTASLKAEKREYKPEKEVPKGGPAGQEKRPYFDRYRKYKYQPFSKEKHKHN